MNRLKHTTLIIILISLFLPGVNAQKFDRGIDRDNKVVFVPKGQWLAGATFSYRTYNFQDYNLIDLLNIHGNAYTFSLSPYASYFFADNLAAGIRFSYNRNNFALDDLAISLGEDLGLSVADYNVIQHTFIGAATFRSYISLGGNNRFGLFNEIRLNAGGGQGKFVSGKGEDIQGTYHNTLQFGIGLSPGLTAFITNNIAAEVSIGLLGFNIKHINQTTNQIIESSYRTSSTNFKIDIFGINLSLAFFI